MVAAHAVRMTLPEHLDELRTRLIRSMVYLLAASVLALIFYKDLVRLATWPHFRAMEWCGLSREHTRLIQDDALSSYAGGMKLVLMAGFFLAAPLVAGEVWAFVAAGLYPRERKYVARFAPASFLLFLLGCAFGYFILVPYALSGMVTFMPRDVVQPLFKFTGYVNLLLTLTLVLGAIFQLPLAMIFLSLLDLIRPASYSAWRRHAIVINAFLAAVLAPPDPASMIAFAVPLVALYEIGTLGSKLVAPAR